MSNVSLTEPFTATDQSARPRRALVFAGSPHAATLEQTLARDGYETMRATGDDSTPRVIADFAPDVVLVQIGGGDDAGDALALARRLRAEPATHALPLVLLFESDERAHRSAALHIGVDDYFDVTSAPSEMCARLDALFWRAEAGRRAAPVVAEQRVEIDNFILLLDSLNEDVQSRTGTLALVAAVVADAEQTTRERVLAEAQGFFKLNLRRIDAVAFYGPTLLLVYLPRTDTRAARESLTRLRREFRETNPGNDLAIGFASFPTHGDDVETLTERAEAALQTALTPAAAPQSHVAAYGDDLSGDTTSAGATVAGGADSSAATREQSRGDLRPPPFVERRVQPERRSGRAIRERRSSHGETETIAAALSIQAGEVGSALSNAAAEAGARERERRAGGAIMPRRLLLTVSNPERMAQINLLVRSAGYEVRAAFDGQQALGLLRIERPDLLLLDYELHGIDGMEMLRRLQRQSGGRLSLPVLMLLPAQNESVEREALAVGAHGIITLPYDPAELLALVRTAGSAE